MNKPDDCTLLESVRLPDSEFSADDAGDLQMLLPDGFFFAVEYNDQGPWLHLIRNDDSYAVGDSGE